MYLVSQLKLSELEHIIYNLQIVMFDFNLYIAHINRKCKSNGIFKKSWRQHLMGSIYISYVEEELLHMTGKGQHYHFN